MYKRAYHDKMHIDVNTSMLTAICQRACTCMYVIIVTYAHAYMYFLQASKLRSYINESTNMHVCHYVNIYKFPYRSLCAPCVNTRYVYIYVYLHMYTYI